ncbi:MAG: hypothetical protein GY953_30500, partial [bacterium]|nr:hypothetical protein [bacterium]
MMDRLTQKYSTILISTGDKTLVYQSLDEVPPELREKLIETTHGRESATLLIADKGGREEILRALRDQPSDRFSRLATDTLARALTNKPRRGRFHFTWAGLGRFLVLASLAYLLWAVISL